MNRLMAASANDQGLSLVGHHLLHPSGLRPPPASVDIGQFADVMHLHPAHGAAVFALVGQEAFNQLGLPVLDAMLLRLPVKCGPLSPF